MEIIDCVIRSFSSNYIEFDIENELAELLSIELLISHRWYLSTFIFPYVNVPVFPTHTSWRVAQV